MPPVAEPASSPGSPSNTAPEHNPNCPTPPQALSLLEELPRIPAASRPPPGLPMSKPIRVLLADDHPLFREGVRLMLSSDPDIEVVGQAASGREAVQLAAELAPDVLLLDVSMPDLEGPEVVEACISAGLVCNYMFLTMHRYSELLRKSIALGVKGYVLKDSSAQEVVAAVKSVAGGGEYLSPSVTALLTKEVRNQRQIEAAGGGIASLTSAQRKVLRLVASDLTSKEIADNLGLSLRTIENHRAHICRKLGLSGAHSLVKFAFDHRSEL